jgi:sugar-phosphatase
VGLELPDHAVTSEDIARGKPAPDGYLLGADRLGAAPSDCLVIEDTPPGLQAGKAAGARLLGVTTTHSSEQLGDAEYLVPDLRPVQVTLREDGKLIVSVLTTRPSA